MKEGVIMVNIISAIKNTIPISQFNKGFAGKIFNEVKKTGAKVVIKNNTPECVLISPEEYIELIEEVNDARLLTVANERIEKYEPQNALSNEMLLEHFSISEEDIDNAPEVEFE